MLGTWRYALRLHRCFGSEAEDPMKLSDKDAVEQLHAFVESPSCPIWLKQRFRRQNKEKKVKKQQVAVGDMALLPVPDGQAPPKAVSIDVALLPVAAEPSQQETANADASDVTLLSVSKASKKKQNKQLEDTAANRTAVAEQHGFPWMAAHGEMRYSVHEACVAKKPTPKRLQMEKYLEAILGEKPKRGGSAVDMMQKFVFHMLVFDLLPYTKKGNGLAKEGLSKGALQQLCVVHFEYLGYSMMKAS